MKSHEKSVNREWVIGLAGNPNVGKSTVFNALTGMKQHTGNWPGKTVESACGSYRYNGSKFTLTDIPGTYSLMANSPEEEVARNFICFEKPDAVVIVADATCLERNLNFVLQVLETGARAVICINLLDEARKKGIAVDLEELSLQLGVPVVGTAARSGNGLDELMHWISCVASGDQQVFPPKIEYSRATEAALAKLGAPVEAAVGGRINSRWASLKLLENDESLKEELDEFLGFSLESDAAVAQALAGTELGNAEALRDEIVGAITCRAERIFKVCVTMAKPEYAKWDRALDKLFTSRLSGIPIMLLGLCAVFWITIYGANYPSRLLSIGLDKLGQLLNGLLISLDTPEIIRAPIMDGVYKTLAWVVAVMLPPMAIFFPLFTLLEDAGYLPRIAFNMDSFFKRAGAHGKQALTMCMGFGCNACGVAGCRIIDSPRERLIGILTNTFVPCNGRFPILISIITMFFTVSMTEPARSAVSVLILAGVIIFGIFITLLVSRVLSKTVLRGVPSSFALELPPYRTPQIGRVIVRSMLDRTLFVLGRAAAVAAPAGLIIWCLANINAGGVSLINYATAALDPFARVIGLDGVILLAFILALPANEIVFPIIIMTYMSTGSLAETESLLELHKLLAANGWTWSTALCTMLFTLAHFPCATTLWTVFKETRSAKWTFAAFAIPLLCGICICAAVCSLLTLIGG